jgi:hypothetical protein
VIPLMRAPDDPGTEDTEEAAPLRAGIGPRAPLA